jgi:hypothetical protein
LQSLSAVAKFQTSIGLSYKDKSNALNAYHLLNTDFKNKHPDYSQIQFIPSPAQPMATCVYYTKYITDSTEFDLIFTKGVTLFVVDATGNDLSMSDDVNKMANILLKRIHGL